MIKNTSVAPTAKVVIQRDTVESLQRECTLTASSIEQFSATFVKTIEDFSSGRTKENNGKSPLELAGVDTADIDWIKYCQRSK